MQYIIGVPEFDLGEGLRLQWEFDFHISVKVDKRGTVVIAANSAGLTSLAGTCCCSHKHPFRRVITCT